MTSSRNHTRSQRGILLLLLAAGRSSTAEVLMQYDGSFSALAHDLNKLRSDGSVLPDIDGWQITKVGREALV